MTSEGRASAAGPESGPTVPGLQHGHRLDRAQGPSRPTVPQPQELPIPVPLRSAQDEETPTWPSTPGSLAATLARTDFRVRRSGGLASMQCLNCVPDPSKSHVRAWQASRSAAFRGAPLAMAANQGSPARPRAYTPPNNTIVSQGISQPNGIRSPDRRHQSLDVAPGTRVFVAAHAACQASSATPDNSEAVVPGTTPTSGC